MASAISYDVGASIVTTLFNTNADLASLANGSGILSTTNYDNSAGTYTHFGCEIALTFASAPTADAPILLYMIASLDGTNFGDTVNGASEFAPLESYVGQFQLRAVTTAQRIELFRTPGGADLLRLPPRKVAPFVINSAGQAFPATVTFKLFPYRLQVG